MDQISPRIIILLFFIVTPRNFLKILLGEETNEGSGKILNSNQNDHVFIYFSDHGAKGLLAFPNDVLHATTFMKTLKKMHRKKKFKKMTIYLEACESGSMFKVSNIKYLKNTLYLLNQFFPYLTTQILLNHVNFEIQIMDSCRKS